MSKFSIRLAIAEAFGFDFAEVENDYRYQYGHTPCPVYAIGECYYTATKSPDKKPKENADYRWAQAEPPMGYLPDDWQLWISTVDGS